MRRLLPVLLCLGVSACGQKVTGIYLASDAGSLVTLEIVETDDHRVSGRAEFETINADGQTTDRANVVTGAVGDGVITIELQPRDILSRAMSLSGALSDDILTLDGIGNQGHFRLILRRASHDAVQAALADVAGRAQAKRRAIELAREQAQQAKERDAFIQKTVETSLADDALASEKEEVLGKLGRLEDRFKTATIEMKSDLDREVTIPGVWQTQSERTQLYLNANQIGLQASQQHLRLEGGTREYQQKVEALDQLTTDQEQGCHRAHPPTVQDPVKPGMELWNTDCLLLRDSAAKFRLAKASISAALYHAETIWLKEKTEQDQIVASARNLQ